jgi:hypothetical protein
MTDAATIIVNLVKALEPFADLALELAVSRWKTPMPVCRMGRLGSC